MNYQELANALYYKKFVDGDFSVTTDAIFGDDFRTHTQWLIFISHNFGADVCKIDACIDKSKGWFTPETFFQTMYVACWIYQPLEKGSYVIDFSDSQIDKIRQTYFSALPARKSSHLEGTDARSAGKGFDFLKGYAELLIQLPETSSNSILFKAEGHGALSVAHALGYLKKVKTGTGETANPNLNNLARYHQRFGIVDRMAENYSKDYKALLKFLEISRSRETVTVEETMVTILKRKGYLKLSEDPDIGIVITLFEKMLGELALNKSPQKNDSDYYQKLDYYLKMAAQDLTKLCDAVKKDTLRAKSPVPRYFNEVKGDTDALECALGVMKTALTNAK